MVKCPFCGTMHVANTLFCSECGTYLVEDDLRGTDYLDTNEIGWIGEEEHVVSPPVKGTGPLGMRLKIGEDEREIGIMLANPIHLGRLDPSSNVFPDIDLTVDGGLRKGVSRQHARILKREGIILIEDLGSVNGTFINRRRLSAYLPETLHHGDQVQLGQLLIEVEFIK